MYAYVRLSGCRVVRETPRQPDNPTTSFTSLQSPELPIIFFTGFPGFLGSELLPRILSRSVDNVAVCLVQPKFAALARERALPLGDRVRVVEGDITQAIEFPSSDVTEIFHLAAIYDVS